MNNYKVQTAELAYLSFHNSYTMKRSQTNKCHLNFLKKLYIIYDKL